jgi:hypothetical protein
MDHQPTYDPYNHAINHPKSNKTKQSKTKQTDYSSTNASKLSQLYNPMSKPTNMSLGEYLNPNVNDILMSQKYNQDFNAASTSTSSSVASSLMTGTPILINTLTNNIPKLVDATKSQSSNSTTQQRPASVSAIGTTNLQNNTETRKFEKINQLLQTNQPQLTSECSTQKPSAYVTPVMIKQNQNGLASSIQLSLNQQHQQQQQNMFYNNPKSFYQHQVQEPTLLNTQPITPPLPNPHSNITAITATSTNATTTTSNTTTISSSTPSNTTNSSEMYYPSQNILLAPSLTLNYGWQNLLQHVDPASTSSLLSLVPHFSNIDLLSLQHHTHHHQKQQQQQQQQQLSELTNTVTTAVTQGANKTNSN